MLKSKDLAIVEFPDHYLIGAGKRAHCVFKVAYNDIKTNVLGKSTALEIVTNSPIDNNTVLVYSFTQNELKKSEFLRALLFGRATTSFQFTSTNAIIANLFDKFANNVIAIKDINDFDFAANCGTQAEILRINDGAVSLGYTMDKKNKVDYRINKHYTQTKASLKHYGTCEKTSKSYSYSKTNKSAK